VFDLVSERVVFGYNCYNFIYLCRSSYSIYSFDD